MKKYLFYVIALLSIACALSSCKKDEEPETDNSPKFEGVFWVASIYIDEYPDMPAEAIKVENNKFEYFLVAPSDEAAAMLSEMCGITVEKGYAIRDISSVYECNIAEFNDGLSGRIFRKDKEHIDKEGYYMEYMELTKESVKMCYADNPKEEILFYNAEKIVTKVIDFDFSSIEE